MSKRPYATDQDDRPAAPILDVAIDRAAEIPIGVQLAWALRARIRDGQLEPGQRLPGLRELAESTGVNVNTARAVYQRLEQEGLVDSQQGSGTFVAATPRPPSALAAIVADAVREAHERGLDPREVAAALYVSPAAAAQGHSDATARRRLLREQIAALERTLGELEAKYPGIAPPATPTRGSIGPTLLDAAELERVRAGLLRRLSAVQAAIDELNAEPARAKPVKREAAKRTAASKRAAARDAPAAEPAPSGDGRSAPKRGARAPAPRVNPAPAGA
jgi:DNA-binding transcriptional regulator YhcF (GntR family)